MARHVCSMGIRREYTASNTAHLRVFVCFDVRFEQRRRRFHIVINEKNNFALRMLNEVVARTRHAGLGETVATDILHRTARELLRNFIPTLLDNDQLILRREQRQQMFNGLKTNVGPPIGNDADSEAKSHRFELSVSGKGSVVTTKKLEPGTGLATRKDPNARDLR